MARYRADLIEAAWEIEDTYGVAPSSIAQDFGLLTGGITLPDPRYEWEPFYGVGVDDRNLATYVQGRQVLEGSFPTIYLCHDASRLLLEQAMGLAFNDAATPVITATVGTGSTVAATTLTMPSAANVHTKAVSAGATPTHIAVISQNNNDNPDPYKDTWAYIGATSTNHIVSVHHTRDTNTNTDLGWQGKLPTTATVKCAIYNIQRSQIPADDSNLGLRGPADESHGGLVGIRETLKQPSFTLATKIFSDAGKSMVTNFLGCKIGSMTISMEEGRPVTVSMDFVAKEMYVNMPNSTGQTTNNTKLLKFGAPVAPTKSVVTEQPYFFSKADIKFGNVTFARFRRLSITISNALDPRYYLTQGATADNRQVLSEILEGRRTISISGSVDMDDTVGGGMQAGPDIKFLQYLLNQGFTDTDVRDMSTLAGIQLAVELRKTSDGSGSKTDRMRFTLPGKTTAVSPTNPGLVLNSARFPVPGPNQVHQNIEIDGIARGMRIEVEDSEA